MRGRRAFVVLTLYLLLLSAFAFGIYQLQKQQYDSQQFFGGGFAGGFFGAPAVALSATVGHALFTGLIGLETLLVLVLAPAFTTGAVSMEREKQTIELLVTTPLGTLAMLIGKLISALSYVFLLIIASIPLASLVFAFGGVGPEDLARAYLLLFAVAFGMGALGMFMSALVKRTQVATVLTYLVVLVMTIGSVLIYGFWYATSTRTFGGIESEAERLSRRPPEALLWFNPFVADADLVCTTAPSGYDPSCSIISTITGRPDFAMNQFGGQPVGMECDDSGACRVDPGAPVAIGGAEGVPFPACPPNARCEAPGIGVVDAGGLGEPVPMPVVPAPELQLGYPRDTFWTHSALAYLISGVLLTLLSAQLVWPTRRLFRVPRRRTRPVPLGSEEAA